MWGIDLNKPIEYINASLRFFREGEHHIARVCDCDVLVMVFEGILRFNENGTSCEVGPMEYYIQRKGAVHIGEQESDCPKYLYVHFYGAWSENSDLPQRGTFDPAAMMEDMRQMHTLSYADAPYIVKAAKFYEILSKLCRPVTQDTIVTKMAAYIKENCGKSLTLDMLCEKFSFSKNHIINLFRKELGQTPIAYLNIARLQRAEQLLITTSKSIEQISSDCGYRTYSHFYRQFMRKNACSPEQFRQQKQLS